jgi:hypothetical protein
MSRAQQIATAPNGAADALAWDLNGRIGHHWLDQNGKTISTLDLLTDGLTLLGSQEASAHAMPSALGTSAPISAHVLDDAIARRRGLQQPGDAVLLRPDGRRWLNRNENEPRVVAHRVE